MKYLGVALALLFSFSAHATAYFAAGTAGQGFSPAGNSSNAGTSASVPWTPAKCFTDLFPGDSCTYAIGNYQSLQFAPSESGSNWTTGVITHQCAANHGCSVSVINIVNRTYLIVDGFKSDTYYYDSTHDYTNPRVNIQDSSHIRLTDLYARGEPQICAAGNPGTGMVDFANCSTGYERYNDLIQLYNSSEVEITVDDGTTVLDNGNHTLFTMHGDADSTPCEAGESNVWIHGTVDNPIRASTVSHHAVANYSHCNVLFEYVDWVEVGTGDGENVQPDNSNQISGGGTFHGGGQTRQVVRYNTFSHGGVATSGSYPIAPIEIGSYIQYGIQGSDTCFAHNSHYREWGAVASFGTSSTSTSITNIAWLNSAVHTPWYMTTFDPSKDTSPAVGYAIHIYDFNSGSMDVYVDGIYSNGADQLLYDGIGSSHKTYSQDPVTVDGIVFGSNNVRDTGDYFVDAANRDFHLDPDSNLIGAASPVALTTDSGTADTTITVDRAQCFVGTLGGLRAGDVIDVNGDQTTVTSVNHSTGVLTVSPGITFASSEEVRYVVDGVVFDDVGAFGEDEAAVDDPSVQDIGVLIIP